eukprot:gb/GFBE01037298.1/.p1 GENE.gb/GFBE01037298.1/~~gb/GFBE01037298.1/.p1  ORF type:complete len:337 (+),score=67.85 gb/GFBE01037298.1/:1-1011(+)
MATRTSSSSAAARAAPAGKRPSSAPAAPAPEAAGAVTTKKRIPSKTTGGAAAPAPPGEATKRSPSKSSSVPAGTAKANTSRPPKARAKAEESGWQPLDEELLPIPHGLLCCICRELFQDPVATVDGHSYCRKCIKQWFDMHDTNLAEFYGCEANFAPFSQKMAPVLIAPMTSLPLPARSLQPNVALRQAVEAYRESRPAAMLRERERRDMKRIFDEMQARHEFILSEDAKTEVVQEMSRLRCRVLELEEQLCRANVLLGRVKQGGGAAEVEEEKKEVKEEVEPVQVPAPSATAEDGWDSEEVGCNLGASLDATLVFQLPYTTNATSRRPTGPQGAH